MSSLSNAKSAKVRTYMCIDMKSFFASVECAERGLNPFSTNLIVADESRGDGTICLAVTPKMKALGVKNRCRRFEIPKNIEYITALPRMQKYIDYAAEIYGIYLRYIDKQDIHTYSIDESFIDATDYLKIYKKTPGEFAKLLIEEIARELHIPATAGIGTNLYLAKIALDITAKHTADHIGYLDEQSFRDTLWHHRPLTDFWGISTGIAARLERRGIIDMAGIANYPEDILYREFGINAELLIDHAWGRESCRMEDIKNYKSKSKSVSRSQILFEDYTFEKARIVVEEMARATCLDLARQGFITNKVSVNIGYSKNSHSVTGGRAKMTVTTDLASLIIPYAMKIYDQTTDRRAPIRRIGISFDDLCDGDCEGYDLFTDWDKVEREKKLTQATIELQDKFGKNAVVMASDLQDGATLMMRNRLIGGHNANDEQIGPRKAIRAL